MKTLYDWYPGRRGELLLPKGTKSIQMTIVLSVADRDKLFRELYDGGRLTGRALDDARLKYEGKVEPRSA